ncbi:hypothetical protein U14_02911 [Candidatus Moduliflexus flocculans]|uniref:Uncharacterized protein n=1 Tax=Candidatus Moduliflexus flocculans TaxID=1499966 RepID=A0A081BMQ0_9BACT|nr:hypothetical protein U14_02911 [Candidatus Moduliflexus flocculans]
MRQRHPIMAGLLRSQFCEGGDPPRSTLCVECRLPTLRVPFCRRAAGCRRSTQSVERERNQPYLIRMSLKTSHFYAPNTARIRSQ